VVQKPPTRRLKAAVRREGMIDVAQKVFLRQGYNGARTRDIAEAAGVSEAIIYRHFSSKEELFEAAVLQPLEEHLAVFEAWTNDFALVDNSERLKRSLKIHEHAFATMADIVPLLGVAIFADGDSGRVFYRRRIAPLLDRGSTVMRHSLESWPGVDFDPAFLFRAVFGTYLAVTLDANMRGVEVDAAEMARSLTRLISAAVPGRARSTTDEQAADPVPSGDVQALERPVVGEI
jgi:AcrR family transcriptional regulator